MAIVSYLLRFAFECWNRSSVVGGAGPAARILNLGPNATDGAICATRREAAATGFDCGAGSAIGLPRWLRQCLVNARGIESLGLPCGSPI
jgi:hypothetical protein